MAAACFVRERHSLGATRSLLLSISLISLALGSLAPRRAHARAAADTVFAGDWEHGGRFVFHAPFRGSFTTLHRPGTGEYLLWQEQHGGSPQARLQLISEDGRVASGWPRQGLAPCSDTSGQFTPRLIADGSTGVFVAWIDTRDSTRIYVQHVLENGSFASGWPFEGKRLFADGWQNFLVAAPDGAGGAFLGWTRGRFPSLFVVRMTPDGEIANGWGPLGFLAGAGDSTLGRAVSYNPTQMLPGINGTCYVEVLVTGQCSGHGCPSNPNSYELIKVGKSGNLGLNYLVGSNFPYALGPDGMGGVVWLFRFASEFILAHGPASDLGGQWSLTAPVGGIELQGDEGGRSIVVSLYTVSRYYYDGRQDSVWGAPGTTVRVAPPSGWRKKTLVPDGSNGLICFWEDLRARPGEFLSDIYVLSLDASGQPTSGWDPSGFPIQTTRPASYLVDGYRTGLKQAVVFWQVTDSTGSDVYAQRVSVDQPVPTQFAAVSADATPDAVTLAWDAGASPTGTFALDRTTGTIDAWQSLARLQPDGTGRIAYVDRGVTAGATYRYRLTSPEGRSLITEVAVPLRASFALDGAVTNPSVGSPLVRFSLASTAPATLELIDLSGRRVRTREVGALGAGRHELVLGAAPAPGLYWLRLQQGASQAVRRVVVVR